MKNQKRQICRAIFEEICVLASGEVVCSCCDPAGIKVYGNVREQTIEEIFRGRGYRSMRRYQLRSDPGAYCPVLKDNCPSRIHAATPMNTEEGLSIKYLQLEPISHCNLDCPECPVHNFDVDPRYRGNRKGQLDLEEMLDIVRQLPDLQQILFYNYGEPFLHADAIPFLRGVKQLNPGIYIDVSTNGIPLTESKIEAIASERLLNHVLFSIDGAGQESYSLYRRNGSFARAFDNMVKLRQAVERHGAAKAIGLTWQYILFEWNDGDKEIRQAKDLAQEHGIPMKWVLTHTPGKSRRFSYDSPQYRELVDGSGSYENLTRELKAVDLLENAVQGGCYACDIQCSRNDSTESCINISVTIMNTSKRDWIPESGDTFKIALMLMDNRGKTLYRVDGWNIEESIPVGGLVEKVIYFETPLLRDASYLMVDLSDHESCLFKNRGSTPLLIETSSVSAT